MITNKINGALENTAYQKYKILKEVTRCNSYYGIAEVPKPCVKILNLPSWPFREPVDTMTLGIPNDK